MPVQHANRRACYQNGSFALPSLVLLLSFLATLTHAQSHPTLLLQWGIESTFSNNIQRPFPPFRAGVLSHEPLSINLRGVCPVIMTTEYKAYTSSLCANLQGHRMLPNPTGIDDFISPNIIEIPITNPGLRFVSMFPSGHNNIRWALSDDGELYTFPFNVRYYYYGSDNATSFLTTGQPFNTSTLAEPEDTRFTHIFAHADNGIFVATSGRIYLESDKYCLQGNENATADLFVPLQGVPLLLDPSARPIISMTEENAAAIINNEVYTWGSSNFNQTGRGVDSCFRIPARVHFTDVVPSTTVWTHMQVARYATMLIAQDGTVVMVGDDSQPAPNRIIPELTNLVQSGPSGNTSSFLTQLSVTYGGFLFLMQDGDIWGWKFGWVSGTAAWSLGLDLAITAPPGPYLVSMVNSLPSNYQIYALSSADFDSALVTAMARPKSSSNTEISPLPIGKPKPSSKPLLIWQSIFLELTTKNLFENRVSEVFMDTSHLPGDEFGVIKKISFTPTHFVFLTESGKVMYAGASSDYGTSPLSFGTGTRAPLAMPQKLLGGQIAVDIAASSQDSFVLLSNGSIVTWGYQALNTPPTPTTMTRDESSASHGKTKRSSTAVPIGSLDPADYATIRLLQPPSGVHFTSILAYESAVTALDDDGVLYSWGRLQSSSVLLHFPIPHPTLHYTYGSIKLFAIHATGFCAIAVAESQQYELIWGTWTTGLEIDAAPQTNDTNAIYSTIDTHSLPGFNVSQVIQIECHDTACVFLTNNTLFGLGLHAGWFQKGPTPGNYTVPTPLSLKGVPSCTLKKFSLDTGTLYILCEGGYLWTTCGDPLSRCFDPSTVVPLMSEYNILDIFSSHFHTSSSSLRCAIASPEKRQFDRGFGSAPFLNLMFGSTSSGGAFNCTLLDPEAYDQIYLLPQGHPLESATATNISAGDSGFLYDGFFDDGSPRAIRWGSTFTILVATVEPHSAPVYLPRTMMTPELLTVIPQQGISLLAYSNCSIIPVVGARSDYFNTYPHLPGSLSIVNDPEYWSNHWIWERETTLFLDYDYSQSECINSNATLVETQCTTIFYGIIVAVTNNYWCVSKSSDGDLFIWSVVYLIDPLIGNPSQLGCLSGMYGNVTACNQKIYEQGSNSWLFEGKFDIRNSSLSSKSIASYSVGGQHALVLATDGTIHSWGLNDRGQLGSDTKSTPISEWALELPQKLPSVGGINMPVRRLIATARSSYAISDNFMFSWGDNTFGQLGVGLNREQLLFSAQPHLVKTPPKTFKDVKCSAYACFVLYFDGELYSWGASEKGSLARPSVAPWYYDPTPAIATLLNFPGPHRRIAEIYTSASTSSVLVRGAISNDPAPPACIGSAPAPNSYCVDGVWTIVGDVTFGGGSTGNDGTSTVVLSGPTTVLGNATVPPGSTVVFTIPSSPDGTSLHDPTKPLLNVSGCFVLEGDIAIQLDAVTWRSIKSRLNNEQILLLESSCSMISGTISMSVDTPKDCRKTKAKTNQVERPGGRFGLVTTFEVSSKNCNVWWIVLLSVLCGVIIIVVLILLVYFAWKKRSTAKPRLNTHIVQ